MILSLQTSYKKTEVLVIPISEDQKTKIPSQLPPTLKKKLKNLSENLITGKSSQTETLHLIHDDKSLIVLFAGLGKKKDIINHNLKEAGAKAAKQLSKYKAKTVTICPPGSSKASNDFQMFSLGFMLGSYKFDTFYTEKKNKQHQYKKISLLTTNKELVKKDLDELNALVKAIYYTRDLVNTPPNKMTPKQLTKEAKAVAKLCGRNMKVTVFDEKKMEKLKMGLILGVGAGSHQENQMIFMEYKKSPKNKKPIMIVGKGITFDAGGLNLKPTNSIEDMKSDMAGAASVLGIMRIIAEQKPNLHVIGIISSAENLVGAKAMKPGDILTAYNGKTVEITNTDAEGRLVLADALSYSTKKYDPEFVLDMATLTGACIAALGFESTGVVTNTPALYSILEAASEKTGQMVWQLPLTKTFQNKVNGEISDYKNWTAGVGAGSSMGGAFLEKFINKKPWIHLDIAGSSWTPTNSPLAQRGATGQPVHTIWEMVKAYAE